MEPVRPPPYAVDAAALESDSDLEVFTAGGPGGQHRNKTRTGVRLRHVPSGVVITATERRSLEANRRAAFARLAARLERLNRVPVKRVPTRPTRSSVERRLTAKSKSSHRKARRQRPPPED